MMALSRQVCELVHGAPFEGGSLQDELLVKRETMQDLLTFTPQSLWFLSGDAPRRRVGMWIPLG